MKNGLPNISIPNIIRNVPNNAEILLKAEEAKLDAQCASGYYKRITKLIEDFNEEIGQDYDLGACLVSYGVNNIINVESFGYYNPGLMLIYGNLNGEPVQLVQHTSQINLLLKRIKRVDTSKPKKKIGFQLHNES